MEKSINVIGVGPENSYVTTKDQCSSLKSFVPIRTLTFDNGDKEAVVDFSGDEVTYSGDLPVDEAAKLFFDLILQQLKPQCKTCRWYDTGVYHQCVCPKMVYGYGSREADRDGLVVEDDEGWGMVPGPDFGCIQHEDKP